MKTAGGISGINNSKSHETFRYFYSLLTLSGQASKFINFLVHLKSCISKYTDYGRPRKTYCIVASSNVCY